MPLPQGFSQWEHLQDVLRNYHNKLVREEFSDITDDDALAIPRGALKRACLLDDDDTVDMTLLRLHLFFFHARKAADLQAPIYGIPVADYDSQVKYRPQVNLYFKQDADSVPSGRSPVAAEISFRLMNESSTTLTEAELKTIANRIKSELGAADGYRWRKGKVVVTYKNLEDGLNLKMFAFSEAEGIEIIRKVCDCAQRPYNDDYVTTHETKKTFSSTPGTQIILGKSRNKPVERPTVYVRFHNASVAIRGLPNPIFLVTKRFAPKPGLVSF